MAAVPFRAGPRREAGGGGHGGEPCTRFGAGMPFREPACAARSYSEGGRPLKTKCYTYVSMQDLKKRVLCRVSMYLHIVVRPSAAH